MVNIGISKIILTSLLGIGMQLHVVTSAVFVVRSPKFKVNLQVARLSIIHAKHIKKE